MTMTQWKTLSAGVVLGSLATAMAVIAGAPASIDPVLQSPQIYTVRLENDKVRVLEYRLKPGQKEPMHTHERERVLYDFGNATLRLTMADGTTTTHVGKAGEITWGTPPITHAAENIGSTDAHYLAIELKNGKP
jgi:quercetin dioxygenase-like cupin family protein